MIRNYIKTAWRNIVRNRVFSLINLLGLSVSLAFCTLVMLYLYDEHSYDKFHANGDRLYQISRIEYLVDDPKIKTGLFDFSENKDIMEYRAQPMPLAYVVKNEIPGVEKASRFLTGQLNILKDGKVHSEMAKHVDPDFLDMFSFDLLYGNKQGALDKPTDIIISAPKALEYFGRLDVVGEMIQLKTDENDLLTITGVMEVPKKSSIRMSFLRNVATCTYCERSRENWGSRFSTLFIQISPNLAPNEIETKIDLAVADELKEDKEYWRLKRKLSEQNPVFNYSLTNVEARHIKFFSNKLYRVILVGLSLLIFLIATSNYVSINLSTTARRSSEIAIRRAIGANGQQLFFQFLGESFLLILLALFFSITLIQGTLPLFNQLTGKSIDSSLLLQKEILIGVVSLSMIFCLAAGGYLSLILSRLKTHLSLKSSNGRVKLGAKFTQGITVFQFMICVFLISIAVVMNRQFEYISEKDLGFDTESVLLLDDVQGITAELKDELQKIPQVLGVSLAGGGVRGNGMYAQHVGDHRVVYSYIDDDFIKVLNLKVVEELNAEEEIGKRLIVTKNLYDLISADSTLDNNSINGMPVAQIVSDFHFASLLEPIYPTIFEVDNNLNSEWFGNAYVKISTTNVPIRDVISEIEKVWNRVAPDRFFEFEFLDQAIDDQYKTQKTQVKTINASMTMAIILACIGLFGLVSIKINNRVKEVGIRKVLGASIQSIFNLLSKEYLLTMVVANVIAIPIAYYASKNWIEVFEFRMNLSIWMFLLPLIFIVFIGFISISGLLLKAAKTNPVHSLRHE